MRTVAKRQRRGNSGSGAQTSKFKGALTAISCAQYTSTSDQRVGFETNGTQSANAARLVQTAASDMKTGLLDLGSADCEEANSIGNAFAKTLVEDLSARRLVKELNELRGMETDKLDLAREAVQSLIEGYKAKQSKMAEWPCIDGELEFILPVQKTLETRALDQLGKLGSICNFEKLVSAASVKHMMPQEGEKVFETPTVLAAYRCLRARAEFLAEALSDSDQIPVLYGNFLRRYLELDLYALMGRLQLQFGFQSFRKLVLDVTPNFHEKPRSLTHAEITSVLDHILWDAQPRDPVWQDWTDQPDTTNLSPQEMAPIHLAHIKPHQTNAAAAAILQRVSSRKYKLEIGGETTLLFHRLETRTPENQALHRNVREARGWRKLERDRISFVYVAHRLSEFETAYNLWKVTEFAPEKAASSFLRKKFRSARARAGRFMSSFNRCIEKEEHF